MQAFERYVVDLNDGAETFSLGPAKRRRDRELNVRAIFPIGDPLLHSTTGPRRTRLSTPLRSRSPVDSACVNVADLLDRGRVRWSRATQHQFLSAVRDGTIPEPAFNTWLAQDYRFAADLLRFQARLLGKASRPAQAVLAAGLVALVDELHWFEHRAAARHIDLEADPLPATVAYGRLLERLDGVDFAVALTMLWALERAYLDAWTYAAPGAPAYQEFIAHWTTPQFASYVAALEAAANETLHEDADVDVLFAEVIEAEVGFWDMAWEQAT